MIVVIVDYGSGNLRSAQKAFEAVARAEDLRVDVVVTDAAETVATADAIVLPGQGAFADCMRGLRSVPGMVDAIGEAVQIRGRPFFGICVGMQLLADLGREHGEHAGLGWIGGEVVPLAPSDPSLKIPHMGWNELAIDRRHPVLDDISPGDHAYFVHSYQLVASNPQDRLLSTDYGGTVTAMVARDTIIGTQFHPEKSQTAGLRLIRNFLRWRP